MRSRKRFWGLLVLTIVLTAALGAGGALAQDEYDPVVGPSHHVEIKKTLDLKGSENGPDHTVTYNVTLDNTNPTGIGSSIQGAVSPVTMTFGGNKTSDSKYIDFSTVKFTKPGVYTYKIQESIPSGLGIQAKADSTTTYYVKIYVDNVKVETGDSELVINGYVYSKHANYTTDAYKVDELKFENEWDNYRIGVKKEVLGNQGDKSTPFTIKMTLMKPNGTANKIYVRHVYGTPTVDGTPLASGQSREITVTGATYATKDISLGLKDEDEVMFEGMVSGYQYRVTETRPDGYETPVGTMSNYANVVDDNGKVVVIKNRKHRTSLPTGVFTNNLPYIAVILVVLAACVVFVLRRQAQYDYGKDL